MRLTIDMDLTFSRLTARQPGGRLLFDDANLIAVEAEGRPEVRAIGAEAASADPGADVFPVISPEQFRPQVVAAVAEYIALKTWWDLRPGWKQLLVPLDRLDVRVRIEGYEQLTPADRLAFVKALPYRAAIDWWIEGEKGRY